ncbi:MAG: ZIP family metal transporter [Verrucomicrobiae bacterium]|nr:ZIP family metal transporter [Verrucomicrobiae bacterium]
MQNLFIIILVSWLAGFAAFVGAVIARIEGSANTKAKRKLIHGIVAFGGGILLAAVAFALVPEGMETLSPLALGVAFTGGGLLVCLLDARISRSQSSQAQFMAMLLDFVPEALVLGAVFSGSQKEGILLALFIGAQNLPEGFNAFRESISGDQAPRTVLMRLLLVSVLGPISGCLGYLLLQEHPVVTAWIMSAAAGGILYLVFQDIAPQSKMRRHWSPTLGAVLGFVLGMIGEQILGG